MTGAAAGPLSGRTVVVTRARHQASALSARLQTLGARVLEIPAIAIEPPASYDPLDAALRQLAVYDWLIVTSANTAHVIGERLALHGLQIVRQPRTVAIGRSTAAALEEIGLHVDLVPDSAVAESVVAMLRSEVQGQRILLARAAVAREVLPEALTAAGAEVTIVEAYRTVLAQDSQALVEAAFGPAAAVFGVGAPPVDALAFTSSSTVSRFAELLGSAGLPWPVTAKVFSIGPVTTDTLRTLGVIADGEAAQHDVGGLVRVILNGLAEVSASTAG